MYPSIIPPAAPFDPIQVKSRWRVSWSVCQLVSSILQGCFGWVGCFVWSSFVSTGTFYTNLDLKQSAKHPSNQATSSKALFRQGALLPVSVYLPFLLFFWFHLVSSFFFFLPPSYFSFLNFLLVVFTPSNGLLFLSPCHSFLNFEEDMAEHLVVSSPLST